MSVPIRTATPFIARKNEGGDAASGPGNRVILAN